jgi:hypothetical protein
MTGIAPSRICQTGEDIEAGCRTARPHALSATDTSTATKPKTVPRRNARPPSAARVREITFVVELVIVRVPRGVEAMPKCVRLAGAAGI